jgi:hypothetical protein
MITRTALNDNKAVATPSIALSSVFLVDGKELAGEKEKEST